MSIDDKIASVINAWDELSMDDMFDADGGYCVNATRIAIDVLGKLGVAAKPAVWGVIVGNAEALRMIDSGTPVDEWPDSAWTVGVEPDSPVPLSKGIRGHLVAEVDGGILDLSARQFTREAYGIDLGGPMWLPAGMMHEDMGGSPNFFAERSLEPVAGSGSFVWFRNRVDGLPDHVRRAPGFRRGRHDEDVAEMVSFIRLDRCITS